MANERQYHTGRNRHTVAYRERATILCKVLRNRQISCDIDLLAHCVSQSPQGSYSHGIIGKMHPYFVEKRILNSYCPKSDSHLFFSIFFTPINSEKIASHKRPTNLQIFSDFFANSKCRLHSTARAELLITFSEAAKCAIFRTLIAQKVDSLICGYK